MPLSVGLGPSKHTHTQHLEWKIRAQVSISVLGFYIYLASNGEMCRWWCHVYGAHIFLLTFKSAWLRNLTILIVQEHFSSEISLSHNSSPRICYPGAFSLGAFCVGTFFTGKLLVGKFFVRKVLRFKHSWLLRWILRRKILHREILRFGFFKNVPTKNIPGEQISFSHYTDTHS
jgi:hypothetical protein